MIKEYFPSKFKLYKFQFTEKTLNLKGLKKLVLYIPAYFDKLYMKSLLKYMLKKDIKSIHSLNLAKKHNKGFKKLIITFK